MGLLVTGILLCRRALNRASWGATVRRDDRYSESEVILGLEVPAGVVRSPGLGLGWTRAAQRLAEVVPASDIERIWLFPPVRREEREWGVAVVSRIVNGERRRIYTASYMLVVRGREKGQGKVAVEEVGESPTSVVHDVIKGVQDRAGEAEPPVEIAAEIWYPPQEQSSTVNDARGVTSEGTNS